MAFTPVRAVFQPSQQRGRDVVVYILPNDHELCYEFHYKNRLSDGITDVYICCECRGLKARNPDAYPLPCATCKVRNGLFITDPAHPARPHFCEPRSTPRATARRMVLERCNEIRRTSADLHRPPTAEMNEMLARLREPRFDDFSVQERRAMVEQFTFPSATGRENFRRAIHRAQSFSRNINAQIPGRIDASLCSCLADRENFLLLDDGEMILLGSRSLWAAVFNQLTLRSVFGDGRYKQIPAVVRRGASSQFYTIIGEFENSFAIPLLYSFIPDGTEETYRRLYSWFWREIGPLGGHQALTHPNCRVILDFEKPAMDAVLGEMPGVHLKGCFFHYTQCILRHRDAVNLRSAASKNRVIGVFFRRIQMLPLLPPQFLGISEALRAPDPPLVTVQEHLAIIAFLRYWHDTWGLGGRFDHTLWDHSSTVGSRTTNHAEGFHTRIRTAFPRGTPTLAQYLGFVTGQLTTAKSYISPVRDLAAAPYIRPQELQRQAEIAAEMERFRVAHVIPNIAPTTRQCKDYLDFLAQRLAH
ncbi:hypothetical protein V3C99_011396 [Haemonchus contortus]